MILLLHTTIPRPRGWRSKYVRQVTYDELEGVPELLLTAPSASKTGPTSHQQQPDVEVVAEVQPDGDDDGPGEQEQIDIPQEKIADGMEAEAFASSEDHEEEIDETRVNAAKAIQDAYRHHLERRRTGAAQKIQAAYRRHLKQKSVVRKGIEATQAHYWDLLRERSMEMELTKDSRYYLLFRVPLADILVCLDAIKTFAESEKKAAKKRMLTEDDKGIEESMEVLNQHRCDKVDYTVYRRSNKFFSKILKKMNELQKKLSPSSKLHEGRSVSDLQDAVLEVKAVVESLSNIPRSAGTREQIDRRWNRGWKWISEKQASRVEGKKAEKPKLALDCEDLP